MKEYIIDDDFLDDETKMSANAQGYLWELIRCKDCKWFEHEIQEQFTEYGFSNDIHVTFCYRHLAKGTGDVFDVNVDDYCSWAERKQ